MKIIVVSDDLSKGSQKQNFEKLEATGYTLGYFDLKNPDFNVLKSNGYLMNGNQTLTTLVACYFLKIIFSKLLLYRVNSNILETSIFQSEGAVKLVKKLLCSKIVRFVMGRSDRVIVLSDYLKNLSGDLNLNHLNLNTLLVSQGVDMELFKPMNLDKEFDVICVSRNSPEKNPSMLFRVLNNLKSWRPNLNILIIGKGFSNNNEFNVRDHVDYGELPEYYAKSEVLILTSESEGGVPNVILESMSCATPVVSTNVGGVSEGVKHGFNGYLIDSEEEMLYYTKKLLLDKKLRKKLGINARKSVFKHEVSNININ